MDMLLIIGACVFTGGAVAVAVDRGVREFGFWAEAIGAGLMALSLLV